MYKLIVLAACVFSANAGLIASPGIALASGPALPATLLGRTTINPAETTIVKQQITVDQPEIRYRAVPTVVQTAPVVQHIAPAYTTQLLAAPAVKTIAAPQLLAAPAVKTIAAPQLLAAPAVKTIAAPQLLAAPALRTVGLAGNTIQTIATPFAASSQLIAGIQSQTLLASPTSTLIASPTLLALKK